MDDIEKRARELWAEQYELQGDFAWARIIREGSDGLASKVDSCAISAIVAALTPDKNMVEMPGLGFSMPRWVLQYALEIGAYMDERHPGNWKLGPIQKRDAAALTPTEDRAAEVAKRLIGRFMIECNAVGALAAGEGLARALKLEMPALLAARPEVPNERSP